MFIMCTEKQRQSAYYAAQCRRRKVRTIHDGEMLTFSSLKEASEKLNIPSSMICVSCKHGVIVKGGYLFEYA